MEKIAHILYTGEYSGAEKIAIEICDFLRDRYDFTYICKTGELTKYLDEKNIKYLTYESNKDLKDILRKYDFSVLHAHDYSTSVLAAKYSNKKVISHIHHNAPFASSLNIKSLAYYLFSLRFSKILCVSKCVMEEMYFKDRLSKKLDVIYNWVNEEERLWKKEEVRDIDVLFVGRFTEAKNPFKFLNIIKSLQINYKADISVKMIGRGELKEDILNFIKDNSLQNNVQVIDFNSAPHEYMKKAKVFFVPSEWEGFGLVFIEALINGCYVLATPVGGIKEIFGEEYGNLLTSDKDFEDSIKEVLEDNTLRKAFIDQTKEIKEKFDMSKNINKIAEVYDSLLN